MIRSPSDPCLADGGADDDAVTRLAPASALHGAVDVTFAIGGRTNRGAEDGHAHQSRVFAAQLTVPALALDRIVFEVPIEDPHHCCADIAAGSLEFQCDFSGVDLIRSNGRISRDGNDLVVHWCTADESTGRITNRGDTRRALAPDALLRFHTRATSCSVPYAPP